MDAAVGSGSLVVFGIEDRLLIRIFLMLCCDDEEEVEKEAAWNDTFEVREKVIRAVD